MHELFEPGIHLNDFWVNRIPKKLNTKLEYTGSAQPAIGWGIHIVEGLNWHALLAVVGFTIILTLLTAVIYSVVCHDVSAGFGISSYLIAVLAIVVAILLATLFQSN